MDETEFMRGRVYGADHEDAAPRHGRRYAELAGGPLDGLLLDVTDGEGEEVALRTEIGRYGAGGRSVYVRGTDGGRLLHWREDIPGNR